MRTFLTAFCGAFAVCAGAFAEPGNSPASLPLKPVESGQAALEKAGTETRLVLTVKGNRQIIALSYKGNHPPRLDAPFEAEMVGEEKGNLLIFTDSFISNPNVQGQCGADTTGEVYLHVVSLAPPAHETFSALLDSCWSSIDSTVMFGAPKRLISIIEKDQVTDKAVSKIYSIAPDNSVAPRN